MTDGRLLARNSALNIVGHALPLLLAVVSIPPLVRGLGSERFGILSLAWAAIGYFSLFELGLSRALTQAVAQRLGTGKAHELPDITWGALLLLAVLGVVGAIVVASLTPALVGVLHVSRDLLDEATVSFYLLAATLPLVVTSIGLRGLIEAHQHFGAATALRIPLVAFMFVGPLAVLPFSNSLVPAVIMLVVGRLIAWVAHLVFCLRRYAFMRSRISIRVAPLAPLLRFGGWTTVSNIVSPMMVVLDRFFVGALLTVAAVAAYVTPYEVVVKLLIVPVAILGAVFPVFAATFENDRERMVRLYQRSLRVVMLVMFPVAFCAIGLAGEGLQWWVGSALPPESAQVLQWLAVGVFINSIAQSPYSALLGAGRPDLIARLHLLELPVYLALLPVALREFGVVGAAMTWTLRVTIDAVALLFVSRRWLGLPAFPRMWDAWYIPVMFVAFLWVAIPASVGFRLVLLAAGLSGFAFVAWLGMLTAEERKGLRQWVRAAIVRLAARSEEAA